MITLYMQDDYQTYLSAALQEAKSDRGVLFYRIAPDALLLQRPLIRVDLPTYDSECWNIMTSDNSDDSSSTKKKKTKRYSDNCACDYPQLPAYKIAWYDLQLL